MSIQPAGKTYYGLAAVITGILAVLFIMANIGSSYLHISPTLFNQLNTITALFYCALTPLAFTLGVMGFIFKNDSKLLAGIAIAVAALPFAMILAQFVFRLVSH